MAKQVALVFENSMNGGWQYSALGRGCWTVTPDKRTLGVRFGSGSTTAIHAENWPDHSERAHQDALWFCSGGDQLL